MKNCTWCSSELSRFRGNNYQSGDLCCSSRADKHPTPWAMLSENDTVLNGWNFIVFLPLPLLSLWAFYFTKVWTQFFCRWGEKTERGPIKNMKGPSSQNIRHRKTTQSHHRIYQNWQGKVDCWVGIDRAAFHWETAAPFSSPAPMPRRKTLERWCSWCCSGHSDDWIMKQRPNLSCRAAYSYWCWCKEVVV